jgi:hypothetical protein
MKPKAQEAFWRLWVLKEVVVHAMSIPPKPDLNRDAALWSQEDRDEFDRSCKTQMEEHITQMRKAGLWEYASPREKEFLQSYGLQMDEHEQLSASWRVEGAGMLMWALGLIAEWPSIETQIEDSDLLQAVPQPAEYKPKFRDRKEISRKRDIIELWDWRVRTRQLVEERRPFNPDAGMLRSGLKTYDDIVRKVAKESLAKGELPELIDDDFVYRGQPFRDLSADDYSEAASIIAERHYALNWLCGFAPDNEWDETITDT